MSPRGSFLTINIYINVLQEAHAPTIASLGIERVANAHHLLAREPSPPLGQGAGAARTAPRAIMPPAQSKPTHSGTFILVRRCCVDARGRRQATGRGRLGVQQRQWEQGKAAARL